MVTTAIAIMIALAIGVSLALSAWWTVGRIDDHASRQISKFFSRENSDGLD